MFSMQWNAARLHEKSARAKKSDSNCENLAVNETHMKYEKTVKQPGVVQFLADEDINPNEFRSLIEELASKLSAKVEWIAVPEAEIGKIKLGTGEIYEKLDCEYGLELDCDGLMDDEILQIEAALLTK